MNLLIRAISMFIMFFSITGCAMADDNRVTMKNVEKFKSELSAALAIGSSKEKVESKLTMLNLEHSYVGSEKRFYAIVRKIGRYRIIYESNLLIRIQLDTAEKVKHIEYEIEHSGL